MNSANKSTAVEASILANQNLLTIQTIQQLGQSLTQP
jgi:hypothetical protein